MKTVPGGEVARLYGLGLTMAEIASVYGVSAWRIASRLDRAGARRRTRDHHAALPVEQAVGCYRRQPHRLGELAAELGVSAQLIVDRAQGPQRGRRGRRRDRADVPAARVAGLYRAGWTVSQIAGEYQIAVSTVLRRLDAAGVARRSAGVRVRFPVQEAARLVQQDGTSFAELARTYQVGVSAVRGQLRARGIHSPPRTGPRVLRDIPASQLVGLYATGLTMAQIAARYGVSADTVSGRLRAAGVARSRAKPVPVGEAAGLYRQGASLTELAAKYAVSAKTVRRKLTTAGVAMRRPGGRRMPVPVEEAVRLYAAGQTMRQLAQRYQVCETVIYDRLTEAGTPLRRRTDPKQIDAELLARLAQLVGLDAAQ